MRTWQYTEKAIVHWLPVAPCSVTPGCMLRWGVEKVLVCTGVLGVIICKALWARSRIKRYIRTAYYYYFILLESIIQVISWHGCFATAIFVCRTDRRLRGWEGCWWGGGGGSAGLIMLIAETGLSALADLIGPESFHAHDSCYSCSECNHSGKQSFWAISAILDQCCNF